MRWNARLYQGHCIDFAMETPNCALWVPMGLGKTTTAATVAQLCLYDTFETKRVLIVGPKRVAYKAWPDEFAKWDHLQWMKYRLLGAADFGLTPAYREDSFFDPVLENVYSRMKKAGLAFGYDEADPSLAQRRGKAAVKKHLQSLKERVHIISWDFLYFLADAYGTNWPYDLVILDESSFVKNQDTARFRACHHIRKYTKRVMELTGTPATNGLLDIWSQLYILDQGKRLGETYGGYRGAYFSPASRSKDGHVVYSWAIDAGAKQRIYSKISDIVISLKAEDWLDLPAVVDNPIYVDLPPDAREMYDKVEHDLIYYVKKHGTNILAATPAALVNKLMQIANGNVYDDVKKPVHVHDAKLQALEELADSTPGNLLVAYGYIPDALRIQKHFGRKAVKLDSDKKIDDWNNGKIKIGYAHAQSLGHGMNMQDGGNNSVWYGPTHNLEHWQQMNARIRRSGQEADHVILSCIMASNTLDRHVRYRVLGDKATEQGSLMDAVQARIGELDAQSL